jgi:hypothetical protein
MNFSRFALALASSSGLLITMLLAPLPSRAIVIDCTITTGQCPDSPPGETAQNPLLPTFPPTDEGSFVFVNVPVTAGIRRFFDPVVAIGYDFEVTGGPLFSEVLAPTGINPSNIFELIYGNASYSLTAGISYTFLSPQSNFRIQGIEVSANLDPTDPTAFVTGLTFNSTGIVTVTQTPITFNTSSVPGPLPLFGVSAAFGLSRKLRMRIKSSKPEEISAITV